METSLEEYALPKELKFITTSVAPILGDLADLIADFESNEDRVRFLAEHLESRKQAFQGLVKRVRKSAEEAPLENCIRLMGPRQTHDFLIAERLKTRLEGKALDWEKLTGSPAQFSKNVIPYAVKTREAFGEDGRYQFTSFVAGLVFDILFALNAKQGVDSARTKKLIDEEYEHALKVGQLGIKEGRAVQGLSLEKYLISAVLLKRTGRVVFSIVNKEYTDFQKVIVKQGIRSNLAHVAEKQRYGIAGNVISAYLCKFVPGLQHISPALLFYDYPFMLDDKLTASDLFDLVRHCVNLSMKLQEPEKK